jgi:hypothetical protein
MGSMLNKVLEVAVVGRFGLAVRFQDERPAPMIVPISFAETDL